MLRRLSQPTTERLAARARGRSSFAKLGTVLEESDESLFWLELMVDANLVTKPRAERLLKEADELTAIFTTPVKTAKG
jgi:four helix bundle protein